MRPQRFRLELSPLPVTMAAEENDVACVVMAGHVPAIHVLLC
jgi:hypothetical protein